MAITRCQQCDAEILEADYLEHDDTCPRCGATVPVPTRRDRRSGSRRRTLLIIGVSVVSALVLALIVVVAVHFGKHIGEQAGESKVSSAMVQARLISVAVQTYQLDHDGNLPGDLHALVAKDAKGRGPYLKGQKALVDPWGHEFQYDPNGARGAAAGAALGTPDIFTQAPDGRIIGNWRQVRN